jgi:hypothetical protein
MENGVSDVIVSVSRNSSKKVFVSKKKVHV